MDNYSDTNYKKITMNLPLDLYCNLKKEAKSLGINLTALVIVKLNQLEESKKTIKILEKATDINKLFEKINK